MAETGAASRDWLRTLERILWAATLVALPVTSFRYIPFMGVDTQVRPLSLVPAIPLCFVLAVRCLRERHLLLWDKNFQPILIFILVALGTTVAGLYLAPVNLFSFDYSGRVLRAWLAFGVGLVFLITAVAMNRDEKSLIFTVRWVYVGFAIDLAWSVVQVISIYYFDPTWINGIQKNFLMAALPPSNRIPGLALEPSWLAAQVVALYLPWAFAALVKKYNWAKWQWISAAILAACAFLLVFTFSRSGILTIGPVIILALLISGWSQMRNAWKWVFDPFRKNGEGRQWLAIGLRVLLILVIIAGASGGGYVLSQNHYFSRVFQFQGTSLVDYFYRINAGPRLAYAWAGWTIFTEHPWTGVGFGATGLYLDSNLPDWAHFGSPEIDRLISPASNAYPNAKNLYVRLLAETGIIGFWAFIAIYLLMFGKALSLLRSSSKLLAFVGMASLLSILSLIVLGLTQDSVAMPIVWLPLGILAGMSHAN